MKVFLLILLQSLIVVTLLNFNKIINGDTLPVAMIFSYTICMGHLTHMFYLGFDHILSKKFLKK
jgi:hypothetical protein